MATWDPIKRAANARKHGIDLAIAERFEMEAALVEEDTTENYGEQGFRAIGPIGNKLFVYVFTSDEDDTERAISLREADARERRHYVDNI